MPPPARIQAIAILDMVLLPLVIFMAISLAVRLRNLQESVKDATTHVEQAPWMHRSALTAMFGGVIYFTCSLLMQANPNTTPRLCSIVDGFWGASYGSHKLGVYAFIWFRISTFSDFFSDAAWVRLRIFSGFCFLSYLGVVLAIVISYSFDTYDTSNQYCQTPGRLTRPENTVIGALLILLDMTISGTGLVAFARLLFCSPVLGKLASRDAKIGEAARNIVKWSTIALFSTPMSLILTMALMQHYGLPDVDVALNCFCIAMQYPDSLFTLIEWILMLTGLKGDEEVAEMMPHDKDGKVVAQRVGTNTDTV